MRRSSLVLALGATTMALAAAWSPLVTPQVTKLPTNLDVTFEGTGTYTRYTDEASGAQLPTPQRLPLTVTRRFSAEPRDSSGNRLTTADVVSLGIAGRIQTSTAHDVLDRSTGKALGGPGSWALTPSYTVDRSGSYVLGPPPGTDSSKTYPIWQDEIGAALTLTPQHSQRVIDGVKTERFLLQTGPTPMAAGYVTASGLPTTIPFAALLGQLKAAGIDLSAVMKALLPALSHTELAQLAMAGSSPVKLAYTFTIRQELDVEPTSGVIVDIASARQEMAVKPDLSQLAVALSPIVARHADLPVVRTLIPSTTAMVSAAGRPIYTAEFAQTPSSVTTMAHDADGIAATLRVVRVWIPVGLGLLGALVVGAALVVRLRGRASGTPGTVDDVPAPREAPAEAPRPQQQTTRRYGA